MATPRRLAEPKWDAGRSSMRILHPHGPALDAQYPVRRVAQLEHVALQTFDGEILVHRTDEVRVRFEHHPVIRIVWNGASGSDRGEAPPFAGPQHLVDRVAMDERAVAAAARAEAVRQHRDALVELLSAQISIAMRPAHELEQRFLLPLPRGDLGGDLLSEHVERILRHDQPVQLAAP